MPSCHVQPVINPKTWTVSNVVSDVAAKKAIVINPVQADNFELGHTDMKAVDALFAFVSSVNLAVIRLNALSRRK